MIYLTCSPFQLTANRTLHILHPKDSKNPEIQEYIRNIHTKNETQIIRIGEHLLTDARFNSFDTVVVHTCSLSLIPDYLKRLQNYIKRFKETDQNKDKKLVICGQSIKLFCKIILTVPHVRGLSIQEYLNGKGTESKGLGIIDKYIDINYKPIKGDERYQDIIKTLSRKFPIYLMDPKLVWISSGKCLFGSLYLADKEKITLLRTPPKLIEDADKLNAQARQIMDEPDEYNKMISAEPSTEEKNAGKIKEN